MSLRDQLPRAGLSSSALTSSDREREEDSDRLRLEEDVAANGDRLLGAPDAKPRAAAHARLLRDAGPRGGAFAQESLHQLNQRYGNRYVNRVLKTARSAPSETGLYGHDVVGAPDDRYEREAERVAARLTGALQQSGDTGQGGRAEGPASAPRGASANAQGGGQALPEPLRQSAERAFGADFAAVRVHTDAAAASRSEDLQARAFTKNSDLFFAPGEYAPHTPGGQALLAHELAHVVQQTGSAAERARAGVSAADGGVIQRRLRGMAANLKEEAGDVSKKAKAKGAITFGRGKSTYAQIIEALERYEAEEERAANSGEWEGAEHYVKMLTTILNLIQQWFASNSRAGGVLRPDDVARGDALDSLRSLVAAEVTTVSRLGGPDVPPVQEDYRRRREAQSGPRRLEGPSPEATPAPRGAEGGGRPPPPTYAPPSLPKPKPKPKPRSLPPPTRPSNVTRSGPSEPPGATAASGPGRSHYAELDLPPSSRRPRRGRRTQYAKLDFERMKSAAGSSGAQPMSLPEASSGPPVPPRSAISLGSRDLRRDPTDDRRQELELQLRIVEGELDNARTRLKEAENDQREYRVQRNDWTKSRQFRDARGNFVSAEEFYDQQIRALRRLVMERAARLGDISDELEDLG